MVEGEVEMTSDDDPVVSTESSSTTSNLVGMYSAILTMVMTVVTFTLAIIAIPNSGAGCRENCVEYPYVNTLSEFPQDYSDDGVLGGDLGHLWAGQDGSL